MSQNYLVFLRAFRHIAAAQASGRIFMISKTGIVNVKIDLGGLPNLSRRPRNLAGTPGVQLMIFQYEFGLLGLIRIFVDRMDSRCGKPACELIEKS